MGSKFTGADKAIQLYKSSYQALLDSDADNAARITTNEVKLASLDAVGVSPFDARYFYVDAVNGDDANKGDMPGAPLATLDAALDRLSPNIYNIIRISGEVEATGTRNWYSPMSISIEEIDATAKINMRARWFIHAQMSIKWQVDTVLDMATNAGAIVTNPGGLNVNFSNVDFTASGGNQGQLFNAFRSPVYAWFQNSPINNIAGSVFSGVASGTDPNAQLLINTNITSG